MSAPSTADRMPRNGNAVDSVPRLDGMGRRDPAERKRLDYLRDRRNWYGENDKCSRRAVRFRKAARHRSDRRHVHAGLDAVGERPDVDLAEEVEIRTARRRPATWRKYADEPLANVLTYQVARRAGAGMTGRDRAEATIAGIRSRLGVPDDGRMPCLDERTWHRRGAIERWLAPRR
ncbi:hypothetical protein GCM10022220_13630 [Actinocatenispora rupis]|uniref:Uncharacterized protein n=2 Tax=Actinocatenispora rupis TaxID=519421 RepID=A0A8J3N8V3_9ACTN|nr:hypothetical protein Aru02nite_15880 [Actinocatenispora rupis]